MAENAKVRVSRFPWWFWVAMAGLFAILVVALAWFLRSPAFEGIVRDRVIAELQKTTGGTVELQSLQWNVSKLEIEAKGLTIHGTEAGTDVPLAHADRLFVRLHVVSLLKSNIDLSHLTLDRPVVHLIVNQDGSTNVPEPKVKSGGKPIQELFDLAAGRVELNDGEVLVNERRLPLDFKADDVAVGLSYRTVPRQYDGTVHVGKIDAQFKELRAIPASADAEFTLWRNRAQLKSFRLTSQRSSVDLSGSVDDFNHPRLQLTYGGTIDLTQVGVITRIYKLREGGLSFSGTGTFQAENFATSGKIEVRGFSYEDQGFAFRQANGSADFSLDRDQFRLRKINARLLGGTVTGDAEVRNYSPALAVTPAQIKSEEAKKETAAATKGSSRTSGNAAHTIVGALPVQQGIASFKVSGASLTEVVRMLSSQTLPLDKLNVAGSVNGTVNVAWKDLIARATVELALDATLPEHSEANQLPMTGALRGRYDVRSGALEIAQLNLATQHTEATASGTLGSRGADLKIGLNTNSLQEFQSMLSAMGQSSVPLEIKGRASFNGTLSGRLDHPDIVGRLLATDFAYTYTPAPSPVPQPVHASTLQSLLHLGQSAEEPRPQPVRQARRIHVDSFAGDVQYERTAVALRNGVIQQGDAHLYVDGSATLDDGTFTDHSPFDVHVSLRNAKASDLQHTIGTDYPVSGVVNLSLQATGTKADPHGRGQISLTGGLAYGYAIKTLTSDIVVASQEAQLPNLRVEALGGSAGGSVAYNVENRQLRTDLRGENIDLAQINELQAGPLQERGTASFTLKISGSMQQPVIDAHLQVTNLVFSEEYSGGGLTLDAISHGDTVQVTGRTNFAQATLAVDGTINVKGDMQSDLRLQFAKVDIDPLLRAHLKTHITNHSALGGHASISGPLRQPTSLTGSMVVDAFSVELEKIPIHSDGPVELALDDEVVTVKHLKLASEDTNLSVGGTLDFKGERPVDLYARGHLNMAVFHALDDEITSYGSTEADVTVKGTLAKPVMNGRVVIAHAGFSLIDLPAALGETNGTLVFNQDKLEVEHLAGRVGGGQVNFSGYITYGNTIGFDLRSNGTDIRFRYGGVSVTADQELRLNGTLKSSALTGEVTITRFAQIPAVEVASGIVPQPVEVPNPASPLNNLRLDVRIVSAPELTVQTSLAKLSGDVDLKLRGTGTRPVLLGRINIAEGDIKLNGAKYHLDRGDITFANPVRIDPILDMEATTRVRDFDITIGLHGTIERLTTTYRSDPPLSSDDIIALLAFGRTQQEGYNAGRTSSVGEGAGGLLLGQAINQTVTNRVSKLFGVSSIKINPSIGGADNNPSARLTVEQQVSSNVTLTYITNLTQSAQQVVQFEYNINADYTVQGIRDENGVVSFDLLIRKRKK